jgi:hypothetical protein
MTDQQLSDLVVDLHHFDIRTGETLKSVASYFLPQIDFLDVVDSLNLAGSPLMWLGSRSEVPRNEYPCILESFQQAMFPDAMTMEYDYFAFREYSDSWSGSWSEFYEEFVYLFLLINLLLTFY